MEAGARVFLRKSSVSPVLHVTALRPAVVILHTGLRGLTLGAHVAPGPRYVRVHHSPHVRHVPGVHRHVAVSQASLDAASPEIRDRVTLIQGCVDVASYGQDRRRPALFTIGRYGSARAEKCAGDLVAILTGADGSQVRYLLVGGSPLQQAVRDAPFADRAQVVPADLELRRGYLARMDSAVYRNAPSFVDGFPIAVLELMAAAVPVVGEARGGLVDQIVDGDTGFLVPYDRPDLFSERLVWLRDHPMERRAMGEAARAHVRRHWDLPGFRERWVEVLGL